MTKSCCVFGAKLVGKMAETIYFQGMAALVSIWCPIGVYLVGHLQRLACKIKIKLSACFVLLEA